MSSSKRLKTLKRKFGKALVIAAPVVNSVIGEAVVDNPTVSAISGFVDENINGGELDDLLTSHVQIDTTETEDELDLADFKLPQPSIGHVGIIKKPSMKRPKFHAPNIVRNGGIQDFNTVQPTKSIQPIKPRKNVQFTESSPTPPPAQVPAPVEDSVANKLAEEKLIMKNHPYLIKRFVYPHITNCRNPTGGKEKEEVDEILEYIKFRTRHAHAFEITRVIPALDSINEMLKHYLRIEKNFDTRYRFIRYLGHYVSTQLRV